MPGHCVVKINGHSVKLSTDISRFISNDTSPEWDIVCELNRDGSVPSYMKSFIYNPSFVVSHKYTTTQFDNSGQRKYACFNVIRSSWVR